MCYNKSMTLAAKDLHILHFEGCCSVISSCTIKLTEADCYCLTSGLA